MKTYQINSKSYKRLELTAQKTDSRCGWVKIFNEEDVCGEYYFKYKGFETCFFTLIPNTTYKIVLDNVSVSLAYLCGQEDILETGVCYLEFGETLKCFTSENISEAYCQSMRNRFHFAPFKNWMNDPNGLCFFKGYYHMFYQYNPNFHKWGNMHWGHAVSRDLIHWTHLPVVFYPQIELLDNDDFKGGAYSGSAVVADDEMHLFFTRHFGRKDGGWARQWQVTCKSSDGINFTQETPLIWGTPENVFFDFRDPKVVYIHNSWYMVIGGTNEDRPAVMFYCSQNLKDWNYCGVLLTEENPDYRIAECPDLYEVDGKTVVVAGYISRYEQYNTVCKVRRDTVYYIGTFQDNRFIVESKGIYDFGKDYYAVQSFKDKERIVSIGWNNDVPQTYVHETNSSNGTMSIPREMHIRNGVLYMAPVAESKVLEGEVLFQISSKQKFIYNSHKENCYKLDLELNFSCDFQILLTKNRNTSVKLVYQCGELKLIIDENNVCGCNITDKRFESLTIYVDRSLIEIFVNHGEFAGARRYYLQDPQMEISAYFEKENALKFASVTKINTIW